MTDIAGKCPSSYVAATQYARSEMTTLADVYCLRSAPFESAVPLVLETFVCRCFTLKLSPLYVRLL